MNKQAVARVALVVLRIGSKVWTIIKIIDWLTDPVSAASIPWTITSDYGDVDGWHRTPHKGVDFALPSGTAVPSFTEGTVSVVTDEGTKSFGRSVHVTTPSGREVIYGHLSDWTVHKGDVIHVGDVLGHSGSTGHSSGPHLHLQVNINGIPVNPKPDILSYALKKCMGVR